MKRMKAFIRRVSFLLLVMISTGWMSTISAQNGWEQMKSMDVAKGGSASSVVDSMIYVFGGAGATASYNTLNIAEVYNIETNQWSELTPIPIDVYESNVGVVGNKIYLAGGWGDNSTTDLTFEYDPEVDSWMPLKECPISIGANSSCVLNDTLYVLGGIEYPSSAEQNQLLYYVPETNNWGSGPNMIYDQGPYASALAYDNKVFVFGGVSIKENDFNIHGKSEMYDPMQKTWNELAEMPVPVLNHINTIHKGKFYIFGGDVEQYSHDGSSATDIIQEYDPTTDTWTLMKGMPFKRANMTGQKVGDYVYLFGGYENNSRDWSSAKSEVWRFNLDSLKPYIWTEGVSLDKDAITLDLNGINTARLVPTVTPANASDPTVFWSSSDQGIATVDEEGNVRGVAVGETEIIVTTTDGSFKDECSVTVMAFVGNGEYGQFDLDVGGLSRQYTLYIPEGHNATEEWPLIFLLHGFGTSIDDQIKVSQLYHVADTAKFLIAYPQGLDVYSKGLDFTGSGWNVPDAYIAEHDDVAFITKVINDIDANPEYTIDINRVHAAGWSNGGRMAFYLACALTNKIASVAGVAAQLSDTMINHICVPSRQISVLHIQGTADPFFPENGGDWCLPIEGVAEFWMGINGCNTIPDTTYLLDISQNDSSTATLLNYSSCKKNTEVLSYHIEGGGHSWPGGWISDSWSHVGILNEDIFASAEIWNFFKRNIHPDTTLPVEVLPVSHFRVYPNPVIDILSIGTNKIGQHSIEITSLNGQLIYSTTMEGNSNQIDLSSFQKGVYLITIRAKDIVTTRKIIKL